MRVCTDCLGSGVYRLCWRFDLSTIMRYAIGRHLQIWALLPGEELFAAAAAAAAAPADPRGNFEEREPTLF